MTIPTAWTYPGTAIGNAMVALGDVQLYIPNFDVTDAQAVDWVTREIRRVTAFIESQTGRLFSQSPAGTSMLFDGDDSAVITTPDFVNITLVEFAYYTGAPWQTYPATNQNGNPNYFFYPADVMPGWPYEWFELTDVPLLSGGGTPAVPYFFKGKQNVRLTGTWGWPAVPDDIAELCCVTVAKQYRRRKMGFSSVHQTPETGAVDLMKLLDPDQLMTLKRYRRTLG